MITLNSILASVWAVVNLSANFMRESPDYTSSLETQALMGTVAEVLERESYWVRIRVPDGYEAWTTDLGLSFMDEKEKDEWCSSPKWICTADFSHIYENPAENSPRISDLVMGNILIRASGVTNGWVEAVLPSGTHGWVHAKDVEDYDAWSASRDRSADSIIRLAQSFMGVPYMWGGSSTKAFDCSGLVQFVFRMNGIDLPRNTGPQSKSGVPVKPELSEMRPGDLVFFGNTRPSHVAIYIGNGRIIHCSHMVRTSSLKKGDEDFYDRQILCVRRII